MCLCFSQLWSVVADQTVAIHKVNLSCCPAWQIRDRYHSGILDVIVVRTTHSGSTPGHEPPTHKYTEAERLVPWLHHWCLGRKRVACESGRNMEMSTTRAWCARPPYCFRNPQENSNKLRN
ncbi:hypothetical protein BDM02DRAFT_3128996 [Thelephora ganbajun]|uniref:Uncharacterized protein n=1 Tax=Thelephora ganbajun TaxID=370292 RepID=A0ACB6ZGB2_THEGA|nr:hypothetical protein BDM02DRAFT_3128996 [Thelephora ganbajun]